MTTYYVVDQTTNDLLYLSEFEPPSHFASDGHHIYETTIPILDINNKYKWSKSDNTFVSVSNKITKREFIKKFTVAEYSTIRTVANVNPTLDYYWQLFMLAEFIDLSDADTISGIHMLEQAGLISIGRASEILYG